MSRFLWFTVYKGPNAETRNRSHIRERETARTTSFTYRLFYIHKAIKSHHIIFDTRSVLDQCISINIGLTWWRTNVHWTRKGHWKCRTWKYV